MLGQATKEACKASVHAAGRYSSGVQQPPLAAAAVAARAQPARAGQAATVLHRADSLHPGGQAEAARS